MATPSPPNLSKTLSDKASNLLNKVNDAQSIFNPVTQLLDTYLGSEEVRALPPSSRKLLTSLCLEFKATIEQHFDAFVTGHPPPRGATTPPITPLSPPSPPTTTHTNTPTMPIGPKPSYIQKASTPTIALTNKTPSDNRLFVRINQMHPARSAGSFAILTTLKKVLGPNASLLKEVQEVKTGFALCTSSTANLLALEKQKAIISSTIGDCKIEAQEKWTTYRLNYVPKKVTIFNDQFKIDSILVTKDMISDAIKEYSGQVLTHAIQSQTNPSFNEYYSTWIVSFKTGAEPLKKNLKILKANISTSLLVQKPKITQCNRCFQWHNTRTCLKSQICRLCSSGKHTESNHTTNCGTEHVCPPKCLHCNGPHPVDDPKCPLRPQGRERKSKSERQTIRKIYLENRNSVCVKAGCSKPSSDAQMTDSPTPPSPSDQLRPRTPTRLFGSTHSTTLFSTRSANRFATIANPTPIPFNEL
ncbi:hypothetical protein sscle_12g086730 [Sclerotinia sclerotiorum 1980 UF-70]|uniref:Uncharacterized protein n=1 Tax=Sclerotinia sclerotiorum (strain ATCC 18683 / 1980 / Ss-1) TaxID=665079 RepID=A0A1D9QGZ9_SCLS1|nr:hypothetical protein sscle_12g086730 [Sclerotinia sclerotiorum 1980 UF-70]